MIRTLLLSAALSVTLVAGAAACSCMPRPTLPEEVAQSHAVFLGTVVSVNPPQTLEYDGYSIITFQVSAWWKGPLTATYVVRTWTPSMCGNWYVVGTEYVVFAMPPDHAWPEAITSNCTRTRAAAGHPDIAALGPPAAVPAEASTWGRVKSSYR